MAKKKIQYTDKVRNNGINTQGKLTAEDANEIKDVVNSNADLLHTHNNKQLLDSINQNLSTYSDVEFKDITAKDIDANKVDANNADINNILKAGAVRTGDISSDKFVSGFAGEGYRISQNANGDYDATFDNLTVRKEMNVYQLTVNEIRATNGSIWVSDGAEAYQVIVEDNNEYRCMIDSDEGTIYVPFRNNDIVRCQRFTGKDVKYYTALVTKTTNDSFTLRVIEGSSKPEEKDQIVRIGNTTDKNRQGALYLTSSDDQAPYLDVIDGVTSASFAGKTKVRLGKLDGIVDPDFDALSGYGIYAQNGYFKGKFIIQNGSNVFTKDQTNSAIDGKISSYDSTVTTKFEVLEESINLRATKEEVDDIEDRLSTAEISIKPENISLEVSKQVNSLSYDNRNYIKNSTFLDGGSLWGNNGGTITFQASQSRVLMQLSGNSHGIYQMSTGVRTGVKYTISFETLAVFQASTSARVGFNASQIVVSIGTSPTVWNKTTVTVTATQNNEAFILYNNSNQRNEFYVRNIKMEEGERATAWSPAPEDMQKQINTINTALIDLTPTEINLTVSSQIDQKINNVQVGGRNLLQFAPAWLQGNIGIGTDEGSPYIRNPNYIDVRNYKTLTYTIYGDETIYTADIVEYRWFGTITAQSYIRRQTFSGSGNYLSRQVTLHSETNYIRFVFYRGDGVPPSYAKPGLKVKLEVGNKATDYSPAPEDVDGQITNLAASIKVTSDEVELRATKTELNNVVNIKDTRNTNEQPHWYFNNHPTRTVREFKTASVIGLGNMGVDYVQMVTSVPWSNASGGNVVQEVQLNNRFFTRNGASTTWSGWSERESTASAQSKADAALSGARTYTDSQITVVNNAIALKSDQATVNGLTTRLQSAEAKITPGAINLSVRDQVQTMSSGRMMYRNPTFTLFPDSTFDTHNGLVVYDNNNTGSVSITRNFNVGSQPTGTQALTVTHNGGNTSPHFGGVRWGFQLKVNCVYHMKIIAHIPVGRSIEFATNPTGNGSSHRWITPNVGTGTWTEYIYRVEAGTGSVSSSGFFSIAGGAAPTAANPLLWHICFATVYDMSTVDDTPIRSEVESGISVTANRITMFSRHISLNGMVTADTISANAVTSAKIAANQITATHIVAGTITATELAANSVTAAKIGAGAITADKINVNNLTVNYLRTKTGNDRLTLNENNDNSVKVRHTNGNIGIQMGLVGGQPTMVFYDANGNKVWEAGQSGLVYVNNVPESWSYPRLILVNSISSQTQGLNVASARTIVQNTAVVNNQIVSTGAGTITYLYYQGINAMAENYKVFAGYHTSEVRATSNWIQNGWYVDANRPMMTTSTANTYTVGAFRIWNGQLQDDNSTNTQITGIVVHGGGGNQHT